MTWVGHRVHNASWLLVGSLSRAGNIYPQALGHSDGQDETMGLEGKCKSACCARPVDGLTPPGPHFAISESANMLIMTLAHYQKTGDDSLIKQYVR
jgi:hypothetical protein